MKLLIFDTETSNLINNENKNNCFLLQLGYILYDTETKEQKEHDYIFKCPVNITNSHIHGITDEISQNGYTFENLVDIILEDFQNADMLIAHNINYDIHVLENEINRLGDDYKKYIDIIYNKKYIDTMFLGKMLLKIKKYPKLIDLYRHYNNGNEFSNQHSALADCNATLNVYLKMVKV